MLPGSRWYRRRSGRGFGGKATETVRPDPNEVATATVEENCRTIDLASTAATRQSKGVCFAVSSEIKTFNERIEMAPKKVKTVPIQR